MTPNDRAQSVYHSAASAAIARVPINPNTTDDMNSGPNQRPHGRFYGNRPVQQQHRTPQRGQSFDSNGPGVRVRGTAYQIYERYVVLAREAATSDDRVAAENFYQHAEHYFRIANASREGNSQEASRATHSTSVEMGIATVEPRGTEIDRAQAWGAGDDQAEPSETRAR